MAKYIRHMWSHDLWVHRTLVKLANKALMLIPFSVKYSRGLKARINKPPYKYVHEESVVVQIGAPSDTLMSGRNRAMYFSLLTRNKGKMIVVEPDPANVEAFNKVAREQGLSHVHVVPVGAWSEKKQLKVYINDSHPASNFTEGCKEYDNNRMKEYRIVELPVDTVDNILKDLGVDKVDLISITTNGAEREIIKGMEKAISHGIEYIALACTGEGYHQLLAQYGYEQVDFDDRGYTFCLKKMY